MVFHHLTQRKNSVILVTYKTTFTFHILCSDRYRSSKKITDKSFQLTVKEHLSIVRTDVTNKQSKNRSVISNSPCSAPQYWWNICTYMHTSLPFAFNKSWYNDVYIVDSFSSCHSLMVPGFDDYNHNNSSVVVLYTQWV